MYVGVENADMVAVIDSAANKVIANVPIGQGPQGVTYVPGAVTGGDGRANLMPLAEALTQTPLELSGKGRSQVKLFDQDQVQILQAAVGRCSRAPKAPPVVARPMP